MRPVSYRFFGPVDPLAAWFNIIRIGVIGYLLRFYTEGYRMSLLTVSGNISFSYMVAMAENFLASALGLPWPGDGYK